MSQLLQREKDEGGLVAAAIKVGDKMHLLRTFYPPKKQHVVLESSSVETTCRKCSENAFTSLAEVQLHFKDVHQVDVNIRDVVVNEQSAEEIELFQDTFRCNICPILQDSGQQQASFTSDEKRISHVNEVHVPSKEVAHLQCPKCLQFFKNSATFRKHQVEKHQKGISLFMSNIS